MAAPETSPNLPPDGVVNVPVDGLPDRRRLLTGRRAWRNAFAALRHRNYRLFFAGQLISLTGTWMQSVAQGWLVYRLTNDAFMLGFIAFLGMLPVTLLTAPAGAIADRLDKRRILIATQVTGMLQALALAALAYTGQVQVWHVALFSLVFGIAAAFDIPTRQSFVVELVGLDNLANAIALNSTMFNTARILGPMLAALLIGTIDVAGCFLLNGLSFIAVIAGYTAMRLPARPPNRAPTPVWQAMVTAFRFVRGQPVVARIILLVALFSLLVFPFATLLPVFAREYLHGDARTYGFLGTAYGVGALTGALTLAFLGHHPHEQRLFNGGLLGFCCSATAFAFSRSLPLSLILLACAGWCFIIALATANTAVQQRVPDTLRGGVMGIYTLAFLGLVPVGNLLLGALARQVKASAAVAATAILCAVGVLLLARGRAATSPPPS